MSQANEQAPAPAQAPTRVEPAVYLFEGAFAQGQWPTIDDFLPARGPAREAALLDLVHIDLERRLKAGQAARVEAYLERYPELEGDPTVVLGLIAAEYEQRRRCEPEVAVAEYRERFPQFAGRLGSLLDGTLTGGADLRPGSFEVPAGALALAGYELLGELGRGGMGLVLKGHDRHMGRDVAVISGGRRPARTRGSATRR